MKGVEEEEGEEGEGGLRMKRWMWGARVAMELANLGAYWVSVCQVVRSVLDRPADGTRGNDDITVHSRH
jgi:hypothetical protein